MTNAEAIETLRVNYPDACYEQLREAVDAAIEALKAQDAAGDTISRQAAIDEIDEWIKAFLENGHKESAADARLIQDGIIQLPPSEPEIIRCKDYKWFGKAGCAINIVDDSDRPKETDFCSFAERRTDATD